MIATLVIGGILLGALLVAVWDKIPKIWRKICSFVKNIVAFFKNKERLEQLKQNRNLKAIAIKEKLESGEFRTVKCLFNTEENTIVNPEKDAEVVTSETIDQELEQAFGDKDMIVLS